MSKFHDYGIKLTNDCVSLLSLFSVQRAMEKTPEFEIIFLCALDDHDGEILDTSEKCFIKFWKCRLVKYGGLNLHPGGRITGPQDFDIPELGLDEANDN